jgi:Ankyrin repeats (3 copies)
VRAAALLTSSSYVLEALLQAAPAYALAAGETQHTLMKMCEAHKSHKGSIDCTAVQRRASLLVSRGACANEHRPPLQTPLYSLAADGCAACVKYFIKQLGVDVTAVFADNSAALHVAASGGHSSVVQVLLHAGADVHAQTTAAGHTALHTAVAADKICIYTVKALLAAKPAATAATAAVAGTDSNTTQQQQQQQQLSLLEQHDVNGCTALHLAVGRDRLSGYNVAALTALLKYSSAKNLAAALAVRDKHGNTVLHYAIAKTSATGKLGVLLAACKRVIALQLLLSLSDAAGLTPVRLARVYNDAAVIDVVQRYTNQVT